MAFDKLEVPAVGTARLELGAGADEELLLEGVAVGRQPYLLLLSPGQRRPRVNGQWAPRVALLNVRDQVQLPDGTVWHVTLYTGSALGRPEAEHVGKECPVCRLRLTPETTVYVCPSCATATHCEGEDRPADERLECIRLSSECPSCGGPVVLGQGYTYLPEL
jgi:hypothetical protein